MLFWTRLGFTVGFLGINYILLLEFVQDTRIYRNHGLVVSLVLLVFGCLLGWSGYQRAKQKAEEIDIEDLGRYKGAYKFLANGRQISGLMLASLGAVCVILVPPTYKEPEVPRVENPTQLVKTNAPVVISETNTPVPTVVAPTWPPEPFQIQGLNLNRTRPSIIVDGQTYELGEHLWGARIVGISCSNILVEYLGAKQTIRMPAF